MFDTMTLTKATGAVCGSLLVYMFASWASDALYATGPSAYGDEPPVQAYVIDTGAEEVTEVVAEGPSFAEIYAMADAAAGEKAYGKCAACHKLDGSDGTGPHLNGIVGKAKAASPGYAYSEALLAMASDVWSPENLDAFLQNPRGYVPGTKMSFAGLPKADERANLIKYLEANP